MGMAGMAHSGAARAAVKNLSQSLGGSGVRTLKYCYLIQGEEPYKHCFFFIFGAPS